MTTTTTVQRTDGLAAIEPCFRLIYRSHSLLPGQKAGAESDVAGLQEAGLAEILRVARTNNAERGVTGALVCYDDWFAQVLEGPEAAVRALFDRIKLDPRHNGVELDSAEPVAGRLFDRWAMAIVADHGKPDTPVVATTGGLATGAPWKVTPDQETVLTRLRDLTRGYGRGS